MNNAYDYNNTPAFTTLISVEIKSDEIWCSECAKTENPTNFKTETYTYDPATHACDAFCANCLSPIYATTI